MPPPFRPDRPRAVQLLAGAALLSGASVAQAQTLAAPVPAPQAAVAETVATGLEHPWAVAFLPEGRFLVTERPGRMRIVQADGRINPPLQGVPEVAAGGQGGMLDVITDSDYARNRTIYFCYAEPGPGRSNSTALARARLSNDGRSLEQLRVLFSQKPKYASSAHFGCRIVERKVGGKPDGTLFLTLGDRFSRRDDAQTLDNHHGKIVRVGKDGSIPKDNPFVGKPGALPEIWSYGHRNVQGATLAPDGTLWTHEHGPRGGDEINLPQPGRNYGWPVITYGKEYSGATIGRGLRIQVGMEQPLYYWDPSIAPSGMAFVTSERYPGWKGDLMVTALKFQYLARLQLKDGKVVAEHKLLPDVGQRLRDVRQGPDGWLYLVTDSSEGRLLRVKPR